jgi:hypothetical protein
MEMGLWSLVWLFVALAALAAACGLRHDVTHRPRQEQILTRTNGDVERARTMSNYYANIHGTEW